MSGFTEELIKVAGIKFNDSWRAEKPKGPDVRGVKMRNIFGEEFKPSNGSQSFKEKIMEKIRGLSPKARTRILAGLAAGTAVGGVGAIAGLANRGTKAKEKTAELHKLARELSKKERNYAKHTGIGYAVHPIAGLITANNADDKKTRDKTSKLKTFGAAAAGGLGGTVATLPLSLLMSSSKNPVVRGLSGLATYAGGSVGAGTMARGSVIRQLKKSKED